MSNDKEIHRLFKANKKDLADKAFSRQVVNRLPERYDVLAETFWLCCILCALVLPFFVELPVLMQLFNDWIAVFNLLLSPYVLSLQIGLGSILLCGLVILLVKQFD